MGLASVSGTLNTSTSTTSFSTNDIRSAASSDGTQFWATGSSSGVRYFGSVGASSTGTQVSAATNTRMARIAFDGRLYFSTAAGTPGGYTEGAAFPTSGAGPDTAVATAPLSSPYTFAMADMDASGTLTPGDRLYVSDDQTGGNSVTRYTYSGSAWTSATPLDPSISDIRNIVATVTAPNTVALYGTRATAGVSNPNSSFLHEHCEIDRSWVWLAHLAIACHAGFVHRFIVDGLAGLSVSRHTLAPTMA